jgi:hypothetical protein
MTCCLPKDTQNNIKNLLESGYSYSQIMKRVPGVKKSTISDYKPLWRKYWWTIDNYIGDWLPILVDYAPIKTFQPMKMEQLFCLVV